MPKNRVRCSPRARHVSQFASDSFSSDSFSSDIFCRHAPRQSLASAVASYGRSFSIEPIAVAAIARACHFRTHGSGEHNKEKQHERNHRAAACVLLTYYGAKAGGYVDAIMEAINWDNALKLYESFGRRG